MKLAFKICIVGDPGVGKTSLILRYIENKFKDNYIPTLGVEFLTKKLKVGKEGIETSLIIWDIGGQHKWQTKLHLYLQGADGAIIIFDLTRRNSFTNLEKWINNIKKISGDVPYLIVGNKKDLVEDRNVKLDEALAFSKNIDNYPVLETSAKTGETVMGMFHKIAENIIIHKAKKQASLSQS
ncbi:MAG: GTP-binding protein [Candidatus Helarchaeota archaeon]|nr:GTP-binding protein [Candidatus Helarchaeota archaeon]